MSAVGFLRHNSQCHLLNSKAILSPPKPFKPIVSRRAKLFCGHPTVRQTWSLYAEGEVQTSGVTVAEEEASTSGLVADIARLGTQYNNRPVQSVADSTHFDPSRLLQLYSGALSQHSDRQDTPGSKTVTDCRRERLLEVCHILLNCTVWSWRLLLGVGTAIRGKRLQHALAAAETQPECPRRFSELLRRLLLQQHYAHCVTLFEARTLPVDDEGAAIYLRALCELGQIPELHQEASLRRGKPLQAVLKDLSSRLQAQSSEPSTRLGGSSSLPLHVSLQAASRGAQGWQAQAFRLLWDSSLSLLSFCIMSFILLKLVVTGRGAAPQMGNFTGGSSATPAMPPPNANGVSLNFSVKDYNKDTTPERSKVTFEDVKGCNEAKQELQEVVAFLKDPSKFAKLGAKLPKGVLLSGPPGTGKTLLARAVAGEAKVPFFYCNGSEFDEMFVGIGARRIRQLFAAANKEAPAIIFVDEIDAVGGSRGSKETAYTRQTLNQLLTELDGFKSNSGVVVIGATNTPQALDKALVRPGRFDFNVAISNPDVAGRQEIIEHHFRAVPRDNDVDVQVLARGTVGWSGADLANMVNVAALHAARDELPSVNMAALEYAKDRILMGVERRSMVISAENRRSTAYHEGGHALVAYYTSGAHPVHKATIIPRGHTLGMVLQLPGMDQSSVSRKQLLAKLDVCMGGRVAEELIFGDADVTTGASSDLQQATRIATDMVTKYGMSEYIGLTSLEYSDDGRSMSPDLRSAVEFEVRRLLDSSVQRVRTLLKAREQALHIVANALLERETLGGSDINELLESSGNASTPCLLDLKGG